jgi:hypothetical protein
LEDNFLIRKKHQKNQQEVISISYQNSPCINPITGKRSQGLSTLFPSLWSLVAQIQIESLNSNPIPTRLIIIFLDEPPLKLVTTIPFSNYAD